MQIRNRRSVANCVRYPAVGNRSNEVHEAGLRRLERVVDADREPAVSGELCSLSSNEEHEAGLRRLEWGVLWFAVEITGRWRSWRSFRVVPFSYRSQDV